MSGEERITRELTPFVEVLLGGERRRPRALRTDAAGELAIDEGRATLTNAERQRILLDPDGALYEALLSTPPAWLESVFEYHVEPTTPLTPDMEGASLVTPEGQLGAPGFRVSSAWPPPKADALLVDLSRVPAAQLGRLPAPATGVLPFHDLDRLEELPVLLHGMGTGRIALRELRLRVDPLAFHGLGRRPPFVSEALQAVADALGAPSAQLGREMLFRQRLSGISVRRHLLPDPFHASFTLRPHRTRGLVPATTMFPLAQRGSRRELLRGTPESDHEQLLAYLQLLEDPGPRLAAAARADLFLVSIHTLPNPDVPLRPNHGGIARFRGGAATALTT